jgi:polar amino acid transport system ATP-binding protein
MLGNDPTDEPMIIFDGVNKAWGDNQVLNNLNFSVKHGEKVTIIGPSGSGKTTILRILMTLESPDEGDVLVENRPLWEGHISSPKDRKRVQREVRKEIGMVFQQFNLFPHMTVLENIIEAPIHVLGMNKSDAVDEARRLLDRVGLLDHINHKPSELSGGQQQRVAIARALALKPKVMLFDEPTSALDPEMVGGVMNVIKDVAGTNDITMLLVTHEMRFAAGISDRIVMFDSGKVVEQGPPDQILHHPTQQRTKEFLQDLSDGGLL